MHPLLEPVHLVSMLVLALLMGQHGVQACLSAVALLAVGLVLGMAGAAAGLLPDATTAMLLLSAAGALWVAADRRGRGSVRAVAGLGLGLGVCIGLGSLPEHASGLARLPSLLGTFSGVMVWVVDAALLFAWIGRPWSGVLVRVFAAWMAASAVLVLALHPLRGSGPQGAQPRTEPVRHLGAVQAPPHRQDYCETWITSRTSG